MRSSSTTRTPAPWAVESRRGWTDVERRTCAALPSANAAPGNRGIAPHHIAIEAKLRTPIASSCILTQISTKRVQRLRHHAPPTTRVGHSNEADPARGAAFAAACDHDQDREPRGCARSLSGPSAPRTDRFSCEESQHDPEVFSGDFREGG